jgi:hypothetical protein
MSDEQRVRTTAGWIGVEISRSRVRTPGKAGFGLYRVRGSRRADPLDFGQVRELNGTEVPDIRTHVPTEWTAYAFTLRAIGAAAEASIECGRPARPATMRVAGRRADLGAVTATVPTRWTSAYRGRRDLGVAEVVVPAEIRPEAVHRVSALAALLDEGLLEMRHVGDGMCACSGTDRLTMACVDLTMSDPGAGGWIRQRQAAIQRAQEPTARTRQRAQNAEFQAGHLERRRFGLEKRHAAKLGQGNDGHADPAGVSQEEASGPTV